MENEEKKEVSFLKYFSEIIDGISEGCEDEEDDGWYEDEEDDWYENSEDEN